MPRETGDDRPGARRTGRRRSDRRRGIRPLTRARDRRIYLSPPHLSGEEVELLRAAVESNWIAPTGPDLEAFERELEAAVRVPHVAAVSSGTAALHLALRLLGVGPGDEVLCADLTFVASANAVVYQGARPVFVDVDPATWTLDPALLRDELSSAASAGRRPAAVIAVDLYGQTADYGALQAICDEFEVPLVEDAAEALGSTYRGRPAGGFGRFGVLSFNGNKIITTSGGGALLSHDAEAIERARFLAGQAREPAPHYEHATVGYNYRLSNLLAAVGRGQLRALERRVAARRANAERYAALLADLPGIQLMPEAAYGRSNRWLTCLTIDRERFGCDRETVRQALESENIESRPLWKPMHLQPVFTGHRVCGGEVSARLFRDGLCLPSGSALQDGDLERVADLVRRQCRAT